LDGVDPCALLAEKLAGHPELEWTKQPTSIRIEAPSSEGFSVELRREGEAWLVHLGSGAFHRQFDEGTEALNFIAWCYSGDARLREVWRGEQVQKAVLEARLDGVWREEAVTGYFLVPFWRRKRELVLQNPNLLAAK
jgi:hypothetical protein